MSETTETGPVQHILFEQDVRGALLLAMTDASEPLKPQVRGLPEPPSYT